MKNQKTGKSAGSLKTQKSSKTPIRPLSDRVLILPLSNDEFSGKTASGIIIPETIDKERPERGRVIAVGNGKYDDGKLIPVSVKVGDVVIFSKYGFDEVKIDGVEYLIVGESNILAVID